ncbi:UPF0182 family membrane protein [Nocardioides nematodiphilus]|uniref:UPF0182 family membrane protein n=1 Tax=Nocardioides nematodiphilus TaxID=2849669 RepID=UPI001CD93A0F|nr:UPF0182 family protein [Nocardioides nematodiphilus]MCA1982428.1 UPF0182 family protein [Nocardioides nematodiphilus]
MSELFDEDADLPQRSARRIRLLLGGLVTLILVVVLINRFTAFYTDRLWYHSVHAGHVFSTLFWTKLALFAIFGLLMALVVGGAMAFAFRSRPFFTGTEEDSNLVRYRDAVAPVRVLLMLAVSGLIGIFAGVSATARWRSYLLWRHGGSFGQRDPHFHRDVGFYVFDLPWWHFLVDFGLIASSFGLITSVVVHYLYGGIRLHGRDRISAAAQVQVSVLLGVFVLFKAADYWLDRYDLVHSGGPLFTGIGYTDAHAVLPAKNILTGIAVICAVLFLLNLWRRTWELPAIGLALLVLSAVLLGLIWPAIVQGFQVDPSRSDKERSYLAANIKATREAYAIDNEHVSVQGVAGTADPAKASAGVLDQKAASVPIADPVAVQPQFEQTQQIRSYYRVTKPLDVDHYVVDGKDRAVVLGVREVNTAGIGAGDQTWTNLHTVYTHSNGVIAAYANQRDSTDTTESPSVQWAKTSDLSGLSGADDFQDQIYYGENSPNYSVVGIPDGGTQVELDLGGPGDEGSVSTEYRGDGGVALSSTFRRALYAVKFGSGSFLLSSRVGDESKVLYNRDPQTAVHKVAPWLTLDSDPYPVVEDGRIVWVVDGYTTTADYPESQRESLATMIDDAAQASTGLQALPTDEINYVRNSVKATVDAYDGTVTLYEWKPDPILKAWESAFPGLVKPSADIPADLVAHLRYPDDLYKVQRYQLARYHVTDAAAFLDGSDRWAVPEEPSIRNHLQTPARMFLPSKDGTETWSETSTFVPSGRSNLAAVMSVDSDARSDDYGKIRLLTGFDQNASGPGQIANLFKTNPVISNAVANFSRSSGVVSYGNLLTVPLADSGLLYVQPVYAVQASDSSASYAVLAYVLVSYGGQLGYGTTLGDALADALRNGGEGGTTAQPGPGTPSASPSPSNPTSPPSPTVSSTPSTLPGGAKASAGALLAQAKELFAEADAAGKAGDFTRREKLLAQAQQKVDRAADLLTGG